MPPRTLEAVTNLIRTNPKMPTSRALRASVPRIVIDFLELKPGDGVRWVVETQTGRVSVQKDAPRKRRR